MKVDNMKAELPFAPINFWSQGPWMFFNLGLKFMQTWQNECFSRLRLISSAPKAATRTVREMPRLGCLQNVEVVGGPVASSAEPAKAAPVFLVDV